ncbi:MAG TPA: BrnA antitoxin family protein [Stellaceae bacterium]|nr:BrnA antitoxin family protein [Stellaceae bacterium]
MKKKNDTVRFSAEQLEDMRRRGESRTDWARVDAMTEAELEASIAADPDDVHEAPDWTQAVLGLPPRKEHINIRIDADVLAWFKQTGRGWQTRMNNVLRSFVESRRHASSA